VKHLGEIGTAAARVSESDTLPRLLDAAFDAFEVIRSVARACEDQSSELFPAFMMAAGAAVKGRNALNDSPSLPPPHREPPFATVSPATSVTRIADELAGLAALLGQRLLAARTRTTLAGDLASCEQAARAAGAIHSLLARNGDATGPR
jgi:hypothetical protein